MKKIIGCLLVSIPFVIILVLFKLDAFPEESWFVFFKVLLILALCIFLLGLFMAGTIGLGCKLLGIE